MEPDIENMTLDEYREYEAEKERRLWDDVRFRRSLTYYNEADVDSFHRNKKSKDVDIENMTIAEYNIYVAKQGLGMNPLKEDQEEDDEIVQPLIPEPIHTTPPNDDYVAPATKSILDKLLEEFRDETLNVTMVDEEADFNPTKDLEELERLLAKEPQPNFT
ncbi:hypothetical protein Tco_0705509 [Tanacetum coccineum]|uniref:Uncharacterized protein n=1 Tax=Tanacetum coccineum TaxID=301880 RepID=A0ABQ4Y6A6_9ASTR